MSDVKKRVSANIRNARTEKGLTQKELAERLNMRGSVIGNYESGRQNLTIETLQRIADALDKDITQLIK